MPAAFKTALGTGQATTSGTTIVITTTAAIDIGDLVVVRWASDNLNATTPTATCADGGNTYTMQRQGAVNATAAAGVAGGILTTKATVARPLGSTITVTLSGAVAHKCAIAVSFTAAENTVRSTAVSATGASTSANSGASGAVAVGDLVLGWVAWETRGALTGDADTGGGTWSTIITHRSATSGGDATCVSVGGQYKIPTTTTAQTFNITGASAEWVCGVLVLQAAIGFGTATTQWAASGSAVGKKDPKATVTGAHGWACAAVGEKPADAAPPNQGTATVAWSMSFPAGGDTDSFNRADANNPGPDWTRCSPAEWSYVSITNNELNSLPNGWQATYLWKTDPPDNTNCFAEIDYWTGGGESRGPVLCHSHDPLDSGACYGLAARVWWPQVTLIRFSTEVAHWNVTPPINDPDRWVRLRLERVGAELRGYVDGALVGTWTDPSPLGGTGIGWGSLTEANEGPTRMDNWAGGGIGAGGAIGVAPPVGETVVGDRFLEDGTTDRLTEAGVERKLEPYVAPPNQGSATVPWVEATAAAGKRASLGAGTGQWTETLQVVGKKTQKGTAPTTHTWVPAAVGKRTPTSTVTTTWTEAPTAVGKRAPQATATTQWVEAPTAAGKKTPKGAATTVTWTEVPLAAGKRIPKASCTTQWVEVVTAAGRKLTSGSITTTHTWVTAAAGVRAPRGACTTAHVWAIDAAGNNDPWNPSLLPGLSIWLDASQLALADGAYVEPWPSLAGSLNGTNYNVVPYQPTLRMNVLSGLPVVRFVAGSGIRFLPTGVTTEWTVVYVGRMRSSAPGRLITSQYPPSNLLVGFWNGNKDALYDNGFGNNTYAPVVVDEWKLYSADGTMSPSPQARLFSDGVYLGWAGTPQGWMGYFNVNGYAPAGGEETTDSELAEVVLYDRMLTDPEREQVEGYLRTKWLMNPALTGSAVVTHDWALDVLGRKSQSGTSTTSYVYALASAGKRLPKAATTTTWLEEVASVGKRAPKAIITTAHTWVPVAVTKRTPKSTVVTQYAYATAAIGARPVVPMKQGAALTTWSETGTAVGKRAPKATVTGNYTFAPIAAGKRTQKGVATTAWVEAVTAAGKRTPSASATVPALWTPAATGKRAPKGAALDVSWTYVQFAQGVRPLPGIKQGSGFAQWKMSTQGGAPSGALDPDTTTYLTATGLDVSYAPALNGLVIGLKAKGLWSMMGAIYPFVGGTEALHKWNLKDPRDLDAAYRLTFNLGTHTMALGYRANPIGQTNNAAGRADTHFVPAAALGSADSTHLAFYSLADQAPADRCDMGCYNWDGPGSRFHVIAYYTSGEYYYGMSEDGITSAPGIGYSSGLFVATRTATDFQAGYRNGVVNGSSVAFPSKGLPPVPVHIGGINYYQQGPSDLPCGFASIGTGLSAQNNADLYTVVQQYQTALGRQMGAPIAPEVIGGGDPTGGWAIGKRTPKGGNAITATWVTAAAGKKDLRGAATTTWTETLVSVGKRTPKGAATTTYTHTCTAVGKRTPKAVATPATHTWTAIAQGIKPEVPFLKGNGLVTHTWTPSAVGKRTPKGAGTGAHVWTQTATGKKIQKATAGTSYRYDPAAAGRKIPKGAVLVSYEWVLDASGMYEPKARGDTDYWFSQVAVGDNGLEFFMNGEFGVAMQYGDKPVLDWLLIPS